MVQFRSEKMSAKYDVVLVATLSGVRASKRGCLPGGSIPRRFAATGASIERYYRAYVDLLVVETWLRLPSPVSQVLHRIEELVQEGQNQLRLRHLGSACTSSNMRISPWQSVCWRPLYSIIDKEGVQHLQGTSIFSLMYN